MKKNRLLLSILFVTLVMLSSCNDNKSNIIGKWKFEGRTADVKTSNENATTKILDEIVRDADPDGKGDSLIIEFTNDGKMKNNKGESVDYSVSGNKLISKTQGSDGEVEFKIEGDKLIFFEDVTTHLNKEMREKLDIGEDIKIERIVIKGNFVRQ